ncbi:MAG: SUMF1/EgtB/PvdO family nonheme iron enzyme, partial [Anaerolineaceae bacterium]|nr:SUMF1/EgtB/PvdO family nonheme iron enzyme [Anaerolineaceae bacterium]
YNQDADHPREYIWWTEALAFCESRGGTLPTEAEWEYAARGPDNRLYPWGNEFDAGRAVFNGNSGSQTSRVGSRPIGVSWVGAQDMSGNVWEWTHSANQSYPYSRTDGRESESASGQRTARGGAFDFYIDNLTTWTRRGYSPETANYNLGFRCAMPYVGS